MAECRVNCFGVSHHNTKVEVRERLRFTLFDIRALIASSRVNGNGNGKANGNGNGNGNGAGNPSPFAAIREMVLLSTCHRVELYVVGDGETSVTRNMLSELVLEASRMSRERADLPPDDENALTPETIENTTYHYAGEDAVRHLCRVAAGLDSMVLGETQIMSQIRQAHEDASESHMCGPVLDAVFQAARRAGKKVRSKTGISSNPSSVSSAAVALAREHVGRLRDSSAAVVGLGEIGQLALKVLFARGVNPLHIVNRTANKAIGLAEHIKHNTGFDCRAYPLDALPDALEAVDFVITAAAGGCTIIDKAMATTVMQARDGRKLVIVDIAVPRNVDPEVNEVEGVVAFDVDDIQSVQEEALAARGKEIPRVMEIIEEEMNSLLATLRKLELKPLITELRMKAEAIRQDELERTHRRIGSVDPEVWSQFQHLSSALVKKLFHDPTIFIKEKAEMGTADTYAETIRELFGLEKNTGDGDQ